MANPSDTTTTPGIRHRRPRAGERTRGALDALQTQIAVNLQNLDAAGRDDMLQANIAELPDATGCDAAFLALISEDGRNFEPVFAGKAGFAQCTPEVLGGGRVIMVSMQIADNIEIFFNWGAASALGVVLLVLTMGILYASSRLLNLKRVLGGGRH